MKKDMHIGYKPNLSAIPEKVKDPEVANMLHSFILGQYYHFGGISQSAYNRLPDWMKAYWQAYLYEIKPKKGKKGR